MVVLTISQAAVRIYQDSESTSVVDGSRFMMSALKTGSKMAYEFIQSSFTRGGYEWVSLIWTLPNLAE